MGDWKQRARSELPGLDTQEMETPTRPSLRRRVYEIIEMGQGGDRASRWFERFIIVLIILNVLAFIIETDEGVAHAYRSFFYAFDATSVGIFTIEYLLRLWTAVEVPFLARLSPWQARTRLAKRPDLLIDLFAILPFYLSHLFAIDLRFLRILRALRFFKLSRYSPAMHSLIRVLRNEQRALVGAFLLLMTAVLFASTGMYYIEGDVQPDKFGSVPAASWWAIATLTTVGYGDVTPVTTLGRMFGAVVMVTGLCVLALPVAIISAGFAQEVSRRDFVVTWSLMSRIPLLAELDASEVEQLMPLLHAQNMPPKMIVLAEGAVGDAIYFVASGRVTLRNGETERSFNAGDFFGIVATLDHSTHAGSFITASKCRLLKLHKEDFARVEATIPEIGRRMRAAANERKAKRAMASDADMLSRPSSLVE